MLNAEYLIKREQQEIEAALNESSVQVLRLHLEMANAYTSRIEQMNVQHHSRAADLVEQT